MNMTPEEIVRDYTQAANKSKQIKILADLNMVSPGEIKAVLAEAGVEGVEAPKRIRRKPVPTAPVSAKEALEVEVSVYERIEMILDALPASSSDRVRGAALDMVMALFQEYVTKRLTSDGRSGQSAHSHRPD